MKQDKTKVGDTGTFVCIDPQILEHLPTNCIDCPFCKRHKREDMDDWYMRRCIITGYVAIYPGVNDRCPLIKVEGIVKEVLVDKSGRHPGEWVGRREE